MIHCLATLLACHGLLYWLRCVQTWLLLHRLLKLDASATARVILNEPGMVTAIADNRGLSLW